MCGSPCWYCSVMSAIKTSLRTGEQGDDDLNPSDSALTFDLLVIMGSTVLLTAESALRF